MGVTRASVASGGRNGRTDEEENHAIIASICSLVYHGRGPGRGPGSRREEKRREGVFILFIPPRRHSVLGRSGRRASHCQWSGVASTTSVSSTASPRHIAVFVGPFSYTSRRSRYSILWCIFTSEMLLESLIMLPACTSVTQPRREKYTLESTRITGYFFAPIIAAEPLESPAAGSPTASWH